MAKTLKEEFLNLPNMLTIARILVIPAFILLTYWADPVSSYWSAVIFAGASITDVIDGWLARRKGLVTVVGKFLDPLADKLIVMAALVMLVRLGRVASGLVIVLLAREFIVTGLRTIAASEGMVIAAGQGGKWKTSLQLSGICCLLVHYSYDVNFLFFRLQTDFNKVGTWLLWLSVIASVASAVQYFKAFLDVMAGKEKRAAAQQQAIEAGRTSVEKTA
ncbi:MAG: CDP-diacylglycerol--glycerol-3-phosphate 3-phosphatidyltransferase [Myxococcales bacterium]|jgi:CDP-diacylglycerol--glycerol-3-phosphate 3-phosphatidyltransferase